MCESSSLSYTANGLSVPVISLQVLVSFKPWVRDAHLSPLSQTLLLNTWCSTCRLHPQVSIWYYLKYTRFLFTSTWKLGQSGWLFYKKLCLDMTLKGIYLLIIYLLFVSGLFKLDFLFCSLCWLKLVNMYWMKYVNAKLTCDTHTPYSFMSDVMKWIILALWVSEQ